AQLERIDDLMARKRAILASYRERLAEMSVVSMNPEPEGTTNGAWMPTAVFHESTGVTREQLQAAFQAENIDARVFFWPLSSLPMFKARPENRHAWSIPGRAINLPSFHDMTQEDLDRACSVLLALQ
ncbi:MAG: DegT/DnrJ/EryC1/StrS family aminotransferase, partial [Bacteroidota bacterium]|nr:DegT/DnrJ/EryC1/StrS family aminotransferase [Bacteroidota bacterium]